MKEEEIESENKMSFKLSKWTISPSKMINVAECEGFTGYQQKDDLILGSFPSLFPTLKVAVSDQCGSSLTGAGTCLNTQYLTNQFNNLKRCLKEVYFNSIVH